MKYNRVTSAALRAAILLLLLLPVGKVWGQKTEVSTLHALLTHLSGTTGTIIITADINASAMTSDSTVPSFTQVLEAEINPQTKMPYRIRGLKVPLINNLTGTVRNLVLEGVNINVADGNSNTGAVAKVAKSKARIYNVGILSGSVGGGKYVGGLVGKLEDTARVINCYSFANITSGTNVGGIVGYNNFESKASDIRTMVMNCMFYGDITSTTSTKVSPVYGGKTIKNLKSGGLSNFNYYAYDKLKTATITDYNCALAVEERFLTRFEFYRLLLNSNKKLAAIYATRSGDTVDADDMLKWVLETADKSNATPKPYPVLKKQGRYPSIINYDTENLENYTEEHRNEGRKTGTLSVTIKAPKNWPHKPVNAKLLDASGNEITTDRTITLVRTDKDFDRFNYNYDKVQLPYYNDYGTKNYTAGKVVTGWKIKEVFVGEGDNVATQGTYTAADQWGGYNFADRMTYAKDLNSVSGRVFSQGAYWDVPYGVDSIVIEPYWGNAAYIADQYYDYVFKEVSKNYDREAVSVLGTQVTNSTTFGGGAVKTTINDALGTIPSDSLGATVYDQAIVLVGNFHQSIINNVEPFKTSNTPFTLMSVDLDNDHEPDYSLIFHDNNRSRVNPIRFDFLNIPGTSQAQKPSGTGMILNASIFNASAWFEITNTCLIYFSQFEYENSGKTANKSPIILLGGVYDQFTSTKVNKVANTTYLHVGGNAWFKDFGNGTHSDGNKSTKHIPISVTGGEFVGFYLTGTYNSNADVNNDNAECYISSGYFKELAGAGLEQIGGNVQWQIYDADIDNFYGGGINDAKPILGTITTDIFNSHVGTFCGGPKFGNMQAKKKVTTNATGSVFGKFFGAGYGGNSISRKKYFDNNQNVNWGTTLQGYYTTDKGKYYDGETTGLGPDASHLGQYGYKGLGVAVDFDYEFFVWTSGTTGGRFFVKFAMFSLAECNDVISNLKSCTIDGNFYGGGSLGKVTGNVTSTLDSCTVKGNIFGAGYSATLPSIWVRDGGFTKVPNFNKNSGMFEPGEFSDSIEYKWKKVENYPSNGGDGFSHDSVITTVDLSKSNLGSVNESVLILKGTTKVGTLLDEGTENERIKANTGNVYGGGEESSVGGNATVHLQGNTKVYGDVFGGGFQGAVGGETKVLIE